VHQRQRVYPKLVQRGTMRQGDADDELATMHAIVHTLEGLLATERDAAQPSLFGGSTL
jgi:hypothetical protein